MELPEQILKALDSSQASNIDSLSLADSFGIDHQKIVGAIKSLESLGQVIQSEAYVIQRWQLTKEGELIAKNGKYKYMKYFNSNIVCQFIIDKTFELNNKNKFLWEN